MAEHTPGPWSTRVVRGRAIEIGPTLGPPNDCFMPVCHIRSAGDEDKANARLIATAPNYWAGVEQMLANEDRGGDGWWKGWEMLKAAHAKTTGGTGA
jgi:hypothetical protein